MASLTSQQLIAQKSQLWWPLRVCISFLSTYSYNTYEYFKRLYTVKSINSPLILINSPCALFIGLDYCAAQATTSVCPTGSYCTSLSSNFTYSCTCYSNYIVNGILSNSPYIQQCSATMNTEMVVLVIVLPIVGGIAICIAAILIVFIVSAYTLIN